MPDPKPKLSALAVAALILAVIPFFFFNVAAVMLGLRALVNISSSDGKLKGKPLAVAAVVIGFAFCVTFVVVRFILKR